MFASAEKNTRRDNDCVIKTLPKSLPPKLQAVVKFSQRTLWCLSSVCIHLGKTPNSFHMSKPKTRQNHCGNKMKLNC